MTSQESQPVLMPKADPLSARVDALAGVARVCRSRCPAPPFRAGHAGINRAAYLSDLVDRWLPAAADVHHRLVASALRVADVGCGAGWSTIAVARAYPRAEVIGFDADDTSIADARKNAARQHVSVRFEVRDAAAIADEGPFDLILVLDAIHGMSRPVEVLRSLRQALAPGGSVIIADDKVAARFQVPGDETERLMKGWSIVHCLPVSLAESPSAATGTVIRAAVMRDLAGAAGFVRVDILPVNAGFFTLYRLSPPPGR